eukprot:TRINITY_DN8189_c0_g1_i1.p1 TRINITY_DN8189_c0_g1~~TRINITY_DN8189_c0_g1_i1.p1  ORF type:complete len:465 (-),score=138.40 TRINITY_DN8189_c0_g1_i1:4-1398(-)
MSTNNEEVTKKEEVPIEPTPVIDPNEMRAQLQQQLEYYFSKENLQTDWYLQSQMNQEGYVPIATIANFRMVKNRTQDIELITDIFKNSTAVVVDPTGTLVRPAVNNIRDSLILRDIPTTANPEEVQAIFKDAKDSKGQPIEMKTLNPDQGDCWYATFGSDTMALEALEYLKDKTFEGKPIQARIKTESSHKNFFVAAGAHPGDPSSNPYAYFQGGVYMIPYQQLQYYDPRAYRAYENGGRGRGYRRGRNRDSTRGGRGNYRGGNASKEQGGSGNRKRRGSQGASNLQLGAENFPPLPSVPFEESKTKYEGPYIKYTKTDISQILSSIPIEKVIKPEGLNPPDNIINNDAITTLEISNPYPKRVTVAEIVASPAKNVPEPKIEKSEKTKGNSSEKQEKPKSAEKPEKSKGNSNEKKKSDKSKSEKKPKNTEKSQKGKKPEKPKTEETQKPAEIQEKTQTQENNST